LNVQHGKRTIALPARRPSSGNGRRAPTNALHSLDQPRRVRIAQPRDLPRVAVPAKVAPLRRSRGRSPVPIVRRSSPTPDRLGMPLPLARISSHPDLRGCRSKPSSQNPNLLHAPAQRALLLAALQRAVRRFVEQALTGPAVVEAAKVVPASSGPDLKERALTGRDQIEQDRIVPDQTDRVLTAHRSTGPAALVPAAASVLGNLDQAVPLVLKVIVRGPSPPALANRAPEVLAPATNAPGHRRPVSLRGSRSPAVPADLPREAAQNQPLVPDHPDSRSPVQASRVKPADESRPRGDPADQGPVANVLVASPAARKKVDFSKIRLRMQSRRIAC